jgi:hypothetical protein
MDVAVFVGFAAAGPLHRPVPVESIGQFEMIFGADAQLAWDTARGEAVYAYLAPAVRAFFRNGGRRGWIIRVAGAAQVSYFPIPGLAQASFDDARQLAALRPAFARARSAGSWADGLVVGTSLLSQSVALTVESLDPPAFRVTLTSPNDLAVGDLLRVTFEAGYVLFCAVSSIEAGQSSPPTRSTYRVTGDKAVWFRPGWAQAPSVSTGQAIGFTHGVDGTPVSASMPMLPESPLQPDWPAGGRDAPVQLDLDLAYGAAPQTGSLLRVNFGSDTFWLHIEAVSAASAEASPPAAGVLVSGHGLWWIAGPAASLGATGAVVEAAERLAFELWTYGGDGQALRLSDLTFDARHPLSWDALPPDEQLFPEPGQLPRTDRADLWAGAADPRFPLAGQDQPDTLYVPIAIPLAPDFYLGSEAPQADPLVRDGLADFQPGLFLDPDLADTGVRDLINEADTLRDLATEPRNLNGIHAALAVDEATLLVVPDAVQRD